jgi:hypothetical protein
MYFLGGVMKKMFTYFATSNTGSVSHPKYMGDIDSQMSASHESMLEEVTWEMSPEVKFLFWKFPEVRQIALHNLTAWLVSQGYTLERVTQEGHKESEVIQTQILWGFVHKWTKEVNFAE